MDIISQIVPIADPMPLPAPVWLFNILLIVTLALHFIAMNILVGGGVIAFIANLKSGGDDHGNRLFGDITGSLPRYLAATVTLGVAPLLFVQTLYGQFFYSASIIMGWAWFMVVLVVIVAYYGLYYVAYNRDSSIAKWVLGASVLFLMVVAFVNTNAFTLAQTPETWLAKYNADRSGMNVNLGDVTVIPRLLHMLLGAVAVGGLYVVIVGMFKWKDDRDYGAYLVRTGGRWFGIITVSQVLVGLWFLMALPRDQKMMFLGGNLPATILFVIGFFATIAIIMMANQALKGDDPRPGFKKVIALTGVVLVSMTIMRHMLRDSYLEPVFNTGDLAVKTQGSVLAIFLVLFVGGVVLWVYMLKRYFSPVAE